eukprot:TRINITY_DN67041_c6_g1_i4.p1 TRINITY_DN67041_c6_g1~~TRINITY_DN67041_c6_g1_i4.p1  ORF type:complete len:374 (-),score=5.32 TRINITY_DN67041_c6_g1_i4:230-1351(-)
MLKMPVFVWRVDPEFIVALRVLKERKQDFSNHTNCWVHFTWASRSAECFGVESRPATEYLNNLLTEIRTAKLQPDMTEKYVFEASYPRSAKQLLKKAVDTIERQSHAQVALKLDLESKGEIVVQFYGMYEAMCHARHLLEVEVSSRGAIEEATRNTGFFANAHPMRPQHQQITNMSTAPPGSPCPNCCPQPMPFQVGPSTGIASPHSQQHFDVTKPLAPAHGCSGGPSSAFCPVQVPTSAIAPTPSPTPCYHSSNPHPQQQHPPHQVAQTQAFSQHTPYEYVPVVQPWMPTLVYASQSSHDGGVPTGSSLEQSATAVYAHTLPTPMAPQDLSAAVTTPPVHNHLPLHPPTADEVTADAHIGLQEGGLKQGNQR